MLERRIFLVVLNGDFLSAPDEMATIVAMDPFERDDIFSVLLNVDESGV